MGLQSRRYKLSAVFASSTLATFAGIKKSLIQDMVGLNSVLKSTGILEKDTLGMSRWCEHWYSGGLRWRATREEAKVSPCIGGK